MVWMGEGEARVESMNTRVVRTTVRELVVMSEGPRRCRRQPGTLATVRRRGRQDGDRTKREVKRTRSLKEYQDQNGLSKLTYLR